jgi:hypothetical protein
MRLPLLAALAAASLVCDASARPRAVELRDGDLVFQMSRSRQSTAVALATRSRLTHMGVVFVDRGEPWVLEAVEPVKRTPFGSWRRRGNGGRVWVKRLRDASAVLTPEVVARMRALGQTWLGRRYDLHFRWDEERLYCSELAYKLYERGAGVRIGKVQRAGEMALGHPEVQRKLQQRFGDHAFSPDEPTSGRSSRRGPSATPARCQREGGRGTPRSGTCGRACDRSSR